MDKPKFLFFLFTVLLFARCVPPGDEGLNDVIVDFSDPEIQKLYDLQDRGVVDSLKRYFGHRNATFRYLSVLSFSSIQDSAAVDSIAPLLYDPVDAVRVAAAYALGQIGQPKAEEHLLKAFDRTDTSGVSRYFNAAIMEAIGKVGKENLVEKLATISTYTLRDTTLMEGQAWGIYRYGLRGMFHQEGTNKMLEFATQQRYPTSVRLIAANYLSRFSELDLADAAVQVAPALPREDDPRIRMALVIALGKTRVESAANALLYQYNIDQDDRVKVNILLALQNFDYQIGKTTALSALNDANLAIAETAASYFVARGVPEEASTYWQMAKAPTRRWQVAMQLYAAAMKHLPMGFEESRKYLNWELRRRYETSPNPYEKAAALKALANYGWNYRYIRDAGYPSDLLPVRAASVEALAKIAGMDNFSAFFGGGRRVKRELSDYFRDAIETGDVGMMTVAANTLRNPGLAFEETFDSLVILENAMRKLRIPREIEAYNELQKALDYFNGVETKIAPPRFTHKIDWKLVNDVKEDTRAIVKTGKGDITLKLMPVIAPGSVGNFIELVLDDFYKGKNFHRVAHNFVIQGGCPRGDGFGSMDYAIRSELPYLHFDKGGYVGVPSAGLHTEGVQFFITQGPAPHLDGRYTIFAKVESGMDVVQKIEIGDVINEVVLTNIK